MPPIQCILFVVRRQPVSAAGRAMLRTYQGGSLLGVVIVCMALPAFGSCFGRFDLLADITILTLVGGLSLLRIAQYLRVHHVVPAEHVAALTGVLIAAILLAWLGTAWIKGPRPHSTPPPAPTSVSP